MTMADMEYKNGSLCLDKLNVSEVETYSINNPEYIDVTLDSSGQIISGITKDGTSKFAKLSSPEIKSMFEKIQQNEEDIASNTEKIADLKGNKKNPQTKIYGFKDFVANEHWTISENYNKAYTTSQGLENRLSYNGKSYEDKSNLCSEIIPEGETFEVVLGKYSTLSGTMFGLEKTDSSCYLKTYLCYYGKRSTNFISVDQGDEFSYFLPNTKNVYRIVAFDSEQNPVLSKSVCSATNESTYTVPSGVSFLKFYVQSGASATEISNTYVRCQAKSINLTYNDISLTNGLAYYSNGTPQKCSIPFLEQSNKIALHNVYLESGKSVFIHISKRTDSQSYYNIEIYDIVGNKDVFTRVGTSGATPVDTSDEGAGSETGYFWGVVSAFMFYGTSMTLRDLSFGYPIHDELQCIVIGHSYIEGNSISGAKDKRFAYLLMKDIGLDNTLILGLGGESATGVLSYIDQYCDWFSNAKYCLINLGGNDIWNRPQDQDIFYNKCLIIDKKLKDAGITPIWITVNYGYDHAFNKDNDTINDRLIENLDAVDIRACFLDENGNEDESKYLPDHAHPTIATHHVIYESLRGQCGELFNFIDKK